MAFRITAPQKRSLDLLEQAGVVLLYVWMIVRLWPSDLSPAHWFPLLILPSEGLVVLLLLIRRPTERISTSVWDWTIAAVGTTAVLLVGKGGPMMGGLLGPYLLIMGLIIHFGAKLSLWRSFGVVAANRGVRCSGLYRVVRHPMYAGYIISHVGFLLVAPSLWNLAVYAVAWSALVARIYAEERILGQDATYSSYRETVRYRLLPYVF